MVSLQQEEILDLSGESEGDYADDDIVFQTTPTEAASGPPAVQRLLCSSFNQDGSRFAIGTTAGFIVYETIPELRECTSCDGTTPSIASSTTAATQESVRVSSFDGPGPPLTLTRTISHLAGQASTSTPSTPMPLHVVSMALLYKSGLCAVVALDSEGRGSDRVTLWDSKRGVAVSEVRIGSRDEVRGVLLRQDCLIVVCDHSCRLFDPILLRPRRHLATAQNPHGLCASVAHPDTWLLVCPGTADGQVQVLQGHATAPTTTFQAHSTALRQLTLAEDGRHIASASVYGSIIRVFELDGTMVHQLRLANQAQIVTSLVMHPVYPILGIALARDARVYFFHTPGCGRQAAGSADFSANLAPAPSWGPGSPGPPPEARMRSTSSLSSSVSAASPSGGQSAATPASPGTEAAPQAAAVVSSNRSAPRAAILPNYVGSFRIPDVRSDGVPEMDVRAASRATMDGPVLNFHPSEPKLRILHYNGFYHQVTLPESLWTDQKGGVKEITACARDLFLTGSGRRYEYEMKAVEADDDDLEGEDWSLIG